MRPSDKCMMHSRYIFVRRTNAVVQYQCREEFIYSADVELFRCWQCFIINCRSNLQLLWSMLLLLLLLRPCCYCGSATAAMSPLSLVVVVAAAAAAAAAAPAAAAAAAATYLPCCSCPWRCCTAVVAPLLLQCRPCCCCPCCCCYCPCPCCCCCCCPCCCCCSCCCLFSIGMLAYYATTTRALCEYPHLIVVQSRLHLSPQLATRPLMSSARFRCDDVK